MQFSEVKQGLEEKSILLIDVRNPDEIRNMGRIPGSHNIPCKLLFLILYMIIHLFVLLIFSHFYSFLLSLVAEPDKVLVGELMNGLLMH